jgi:hypothetical protein
MGESGGEVYDFESAWRRNMIFLAALALAVVGGLAYGTISGQGPGWGFGLVSLAAVCWVVGMHVLLLARRAVVDGDRLTVTTWGRQRTVALADITNTTWMGMYRLLQFRGGLVLVPQPLGLGNELVRRLDAARR